MPVRERLIRYPKAFRLAHAVNERTVLPLYARINRRPLEKKPVPPEDVAWLEHFYQDEGQKLAALTGRDDLLRR